MEQYETPPIAVSLTAEDYAAFNRYHGRRQLAVLFLVYAVLFAVVAQGSDDWAGADKLVYVLPAAVVLSGLLVVYQLWRLQARTRKIFAADQTATKPQSLTLQAGGILHAVGQEEQLIAWEDVKQIAETSHLWIVYLARNKAILLPKRSVQDAGALRRSLRDRLPGGKLRLRA